MLLFNAVCLCGMLLGAKASDMDIDMDLEDGKNESSKNRLQEKIAVMRHEESDELRLFHNLMRFYDRDVRPMKNASSPVVVRLGITLTQIFDLDEKNQVLTTNVWLDMEWVDDYLMWKPAEYKDLKSIRIPCERIWLPDMVLYNNADDYTQGFMNSKAMVNHDGNVFWPPPTKLRSKCPVDVTYFPFDHQTCILKFGSWIYDGFQVDVTNRSDQVDMTNYVPNGEWELVKTGIKRNVKYYPCCPEPFPDVTITIVIRRRTLYYISNVVLPCMMMSALTLLVFRLPPDAGEKIALGFTVLLAFSVFMLTVAEKMPETSTSVPLIGMYLTAVMAITTVSIMMTVVVLNFHYRGPSKKSAPKWLKKIILDKIGYWFCSDIVRIADVKDQSPTDKTKKLNKGWLNHEPAEAGVCVDHVNHSLLLSPKRHLQKVTAEGKESPAYCDGHHSKLLQVDSSTVEIVAHNCVYHRDILKILRCLVIKEEEEKQKSDVINEWRQMAVVVDRVFFWLFLVAIVLSSVVFLVVVPFHRNDLLTDD